MRFHADLHIHSKYSRATSRDLDLEHLSWWAGRKGLSVVGTGDFTHPVWRAELKEKLVPAEPGLFRLKGDIEREVARTLPAACQSATRFMLTVEISTIYKKGDRTRKIHHLLYAPDFATADRISERLARIGNIASDGRPILGLDSRNLLEITLESDPGAYLVPAHIWTPWFAALGSQSGFDSIVDCYGDLSDRIFAVETGLSSDPGMNWRVSQLDRYRLVSNSDAHSPGKLGREATTFDTDLDYFAIRRALETGDGYVGTVEFFPEEGKYHLDGHRKCHVRMTPAETRTHGNRCPVCGQPATVGVLHRVEVLADRSEDEVTPPPTAGDVASLVPLPEVLSELVDSGPSSKTVARHYDRLLATLGSELSILEDVPVEDITRSASPLLAEAVTRLRAGAVIRESGYDGEYGVIRLFDEAELKQLTAGGSLFGDEPAPRSRRAKPAAASADQPVASSSAPRASAAKPLVREQPPVALLEFDAPAAADVLAPLDDDQRRAASIVDGALAIVAGPGSGKTRTLVHRLAHLIASRGVPPSACLTVTFTRRAASEMRDRLADLLGDAAAAVSVHTFHSLGLTILREHPGAAGLQPGFRVADEAERAALLADRLELSPERTESMLRAISRAKSRGAAAEGRTRADVEKALGVYREAMAAANLVDFDDLIALAIRALETDPALATHYRDRFPWVSVDEFQDIDDRQYRLLSLVAPPGANLCVVGDPRQAIYGFRGADASCFDRFAAQYADATSVHLSRNYRSTGTIVAASSQVIARGDSVQPLAAIVRDMHERISIHASPTERAEAEAVVAAIERLIGGQSLLSIDIGHADGTTAHACGFGDFSVLYRTSAQAAALVEAFNRSGLPYATHSHEPLAAQPMVRSLLQGMADDVDVDVPLVDRLEKAASGVTCTSEQDVAAKDLALQRLKHLAGTIRLHGGAAARLPGLEPDADRLRFLDAVALAAEADFRDPRADRVSLLTLHAAKGLEFSVVFIVGLEDGVLPLHWGHADEDTMAEERRLFYVGMTRAKDRLFLSHAAERRWRGRVRPSTASPFLHDIEETLVTLRRSAAKPPKPENRQLKLL